MKKSKNHILTIVEFPSQSSMSGSAKILIAIKLYQALFFQMGHLYLERKRNLFLTSLKQTCNEYLYLNINKCKLALLGEQENIPMLSTCSELTPRAPIPDGRKIQMVGHRAKTMLGVKDKRNKGFYHL